MLATPSLVALAFLTPLAAANGTEATVRLLAGHGAADGWDRGRVAKELIELGSGAVPTYLRCLSGEVASAEPPRWPVRDLVLEVTARLSAAEVRTYLEADLVGEVPFERRLAGMELLGTGGARAEISFMLDVASGFDAGLLASPYLETRLEAIFGTAFRENRGAPSKLQSRIKSIADQNIDLLPILAAALLKGAGSDGLACVEAITQRHPGSAMRVLTLVAGLSVRARVEGLVPSANLVRTYLDSADVDVRKAAIGAAGSLLDGQAASLLVAGLSDDNRTISKKSAWALKQLTGVSMEPDAWVERLASERDWFDGALVGDDLGQRPAIEVRAFLREVLAHPLHRHELVPYVAEGLEHDNDVVVQTTCLTLSQLRSPLAVPHLIQTLGHPNDAVKRAAWTALRGLTKKSLRNDRVAWAEWLAGK